MTKAGGHRRGAEGAEDGGRRETRGRGDKVTRRGGDAERRRRATSPYRLYAVPPVRAIMSKSGGEIRRRGVAHGTASIDRVLSLTRNLPPNEKLRLIGLLTEELRDEMEHVGDPVDMLSLVGVGAEVWREVNVDEYLDQERDSWDR